MMPADSQGPKSLTPASPRTEVRAGSDAAPDPRGIDCATDPEMARNGSGCARIPASALVVFRYPSCSTKPLRLPIGLTTSARALAALYVVPPSARSRSPTSRRNGPSVAPALTLYWLSDALRSSVSANKPAPTVRLGSVVPLKPSDATVTCAQGPLFTPPTAARK